MATGRKKGLIGFKLGIFSEVNLNFNIVCRSPGFFMVPLENTLNTSIISWGIHIFDASYYVASRSFASSRAGADPRLVRCRLLRVRCSMFGAVCLSKRHMVCGQVCRSRSSMCLHPRLEVGMAVPHATWGVKLLHWKGFTSFFHNNRLETFADTQCEAFDWKHSGQ